MIKSHKVADSLFLIRQTISSSPTSAKPVATPTNHIFVTDCSGSMWGEIDKVRADIKTKLPKLLKDGDTLSLIAFSSSGQSYRVLTGETVEGLAELGDAQKMIDKWLKPMGMTGFRDPLEDVSNLIAEVSKKNKNPFSLIFMSDGYENQTPKAEVLKAVEKTVAGLASATVVSYGNYADLPFLTQMAERWGGSLVQSENFGKFSVVMAAAIQKPLLGGKRIEVQVGGDVIGGIAFASEGKDLVAFGVDGDKVKVSENLSEIMYLSPIEVGVDSGDFTKLCRLPDIAIAAAYAAISLFAVRMRPDIVLPLLKATGDVRYIEQFSTLFGRQKYADFQEATALAAVDPSVRWAKGYDPNKVPRDDAYTVFDLVRALQADDSNRVLLGHPAFAYKRIGRASVDANTKFTDEEQGELTKLTSELTLATKDLAKTKEITAKITALTNKPEPLVFIEDVEGRDEGYAVSSLTFNEDRANISILIRKEGKVDLSARLPEQFKGGGLGKIPETIGSFCFRNYAIVKDGIVNVDVLPLKLSGATAKLLTTAIAEGRLPASAVWQDGRDTLLVNLRELPIINRKMVQTVSATTLFVKHWELTKVRAEQKVYNSVLKEMFPGGKRSEGFSALYGEEGAKWLSEQGITDYSGFSPKSCQGEATDVYMAKLLEVKLKGFSSLPSLNDLRKQASKGKFNPPGELMKAAASEVAAFEESDTYKQAPNQPELFETWLKGRAEDATKRARKILLDIAQIKFSVLVGGVWFSEFPTINENSMEINLEGSKLSFSAELREVEEKV